MTAVSNDVETLERENQRLRKQLAMIRGEVEPSKADDRFKQLIEIMPAGVVVIDGQGVIEQCNPAAQELLAEQLLGSLWRDVARRCFMPREDDGYEISLQDGRRISIQTRALSDFRGQLVLLNDVTQTREIQAQQAQSIRLAEMGKMTASLAHQIRTPLSAAVLYTDNLITGNLCNERGVAFAAKVKGRLKNIERQISDMLMFSREEIALSDEVSVSKLLKELEDALDAPLSQYDVDFDIAGFELSEMLACNAEVLIGALVSVVVNALQASPQHPVVRVFALKVKQSVVVSVLDRGPGMSDEALHQAQQPFQTTKSQGTGLGLAIAHQVGKAHGGHFEIKSELGAGTVASFWLPILN